MLGIDWTQPREFLEVAGLVGGVLAFFFMLWMRDKFVTRKTFDSTVLRIDTNLEQTVTRLDKRIDDCETDVSKKIGNITGEVIKIGERTASTKETAENVRETVNRIDDYLRTERRA